MLSRRATLFVASAVAAVTLAAATLANAATGTLSFRGCISGDIATGPTGTNACKLIPFAGTSGQNSGLENPEGVALTRDGKSLYASSPSDSAISRFKRNRRTGKLTYKDCITGALEAGPSGSGACRQIPHASSFGADSGMDELRLLTVSDDGKSLYTVSRSDDAVVRFNRNRRTGKLTYKGCITGELESGPTGTGACKAIPHASSQGVASGLDLVKSLVVSGDGKSLYAASTHDAAVARFKRNRHTGKLTYRGCITGEIEAGPAPGGNGACKKTGHATSGGANSGLSDLRSLALSNDGKWLYGASNDDAAVARFKRNRRTGKLAFRGCITGELESGPTGTGACKIIPHATSNGIDSGLYDQRLMTLSVDGKSLYTASRQDDAVGRFNRNRRTGKLTYKGCITGEIQSGPAGSGACKAISTASSFGQNSGLDGPESLAPSPDGKSLYAAARGDDAVAHFRRNRSTGKLTYRGCITGQTETGPSGSGACARQIPSASSFGQDSGLDTVQFLAFAGRWLYYASDSDSAVGRFKRAP